LIIIGIYCGKFENDDGNAPELEGGCLEDIGFAGVLDREAAGE
jgi:hypothetical protein